MSHTDSLVVNMLHCRRNPTLPPVPHTQSGCRFCASWLAEADPMPLRRIVEANAGALESAPHQSHYGRIGHRPFLLEIADREHAHAGNARQVGSRPAEQAARGPTLSEGHAHNLRILAINNRRISVNIA